MAVHIAGIDPQVAVKDVNLDLGAKVSNRPIAAEGLPQQLFAPPEAGR
jgi:hypothetical protein